MIEFNYFAYLLFSFAVQFTPGPNNIMLSASGMNFGYRRTIPHISGIFVGVPLLALIIGLSTELVLQHLPEFQFYLMICSVGLLLWIAYRIAMTPPPDGANGEVTNARPIRFFEAFIFQIVNPKAWTMIISSIGLFLTAPEPLRTQQLYVMVIYIAIFTFLSASTWVLGGMAIRRLLTKDVHFRIYNITSALTLVGCAVWVGIQEFDLFN